MNADARPSFGKRLLLFGKRLLLAFVKTIIILVILAALAGGGYLAVRELQRSFDSVTARVEINRRDLEALRSDVETLSSQAPDQQRAMAALQTETADLDARLLEQRQEILDDLQRQQEQLSALETAMATAASDNEAAAQKAAEDAAALGAAVVALQSDLNETNGRIDALGGEIDGLRAENDSLSSSVGALNLSVDAATEAAAEINQMQQTMALFHVWELVTRARLRLIEDNVGSATADVERAFRAVDLLLDGETVPDEEALRVMLTRLALAFTNLPENPDVAARDLESAWDALDDLLGLRLLPELESLSGAELVLPAVEETPPEAAPTPEPTPVPSP